MSYCNVCSNCEKEITSHPYAYRFGYINPTKENLCDDCLRAIIPNSIGEMRFAKCDCCDKIISALDLWNPNISGLNTGEIKCQSCLRKERFNSSSSGSKSETIERESTRIYCSECKKEIRYGSFTYNYAKDFPPERRLCNICECKLHRE